MTSTRPTLRPRRPFDPEPLDEAEAELWRQVDARAAERRAKRLAEQRQAERASGDASNPRGAP
jgi:hypothetical protein